MSTEKEWFNNERWGEGIRQKVHSSVNIGLFYQQYHKRPDLWKAAFQFLKGDLVTTATGKYILAGDEVIATISEYQTRKLEEVRWESHKKFVDLQYLITGEEKMGILPLEKAVAPMIYDETKDVMFFGDHEGQYFVANPDNFFLFFPSDVHRPSIQIDGSKPVKKLVIKIIFVE